MGVIVNKLLYSLAGKFNFDLYGRYAMISRIVETNRSKPSLKILDVGGFNGQLAEFLPHDEITILDVFDSDAPNYIKGDALNMTFADNEFDIVVSADVFEHIPENMRDKYMEESYRVSRDFLILAAPFDQPGVSDAEIRANDLYRSYTGEDYIWLSEHIANGLPSPKQTEAWVDKSKLSYLKIQNNNLAEWENLIKAFFTLDTHRTLTGEAAFRRVNTTFNLTRNQAPASTPSYRSIYVISKEARHSPEFVKVPETMDFTSQSLLQSILDAYDHENRSPVVATDQYWSAKHALGMTSRLSPYEIGLHNEIEALRIAQNELNGIRSSLTYRISKKLKSNTRGLRIINPALRHFISVWRKRGALTPSNLKWRYKTNLGSRLRQSYEAISLPAIPQPKVSIVIPVLNQAHYTIRCLEVLSAHEAKSSFEVVIVDNASTDATEQLLQGIKNLTYLRNDKNYGFGDACNQGVEASKGEVIVFLNNDTEVLPGWLDELVSTLNLPDAGLAGSMLIYPNGILQEAGGTIFSDGNGWNYGKGSSPADYMFNYVREVDYCSAASAAIKRAVFLKLGGFDALYSPAYYEDTDLAFGVRELGLKVYYQPFSRVIHYEGGTSGTDLNQGFKKNQVVNRDKFINKWSGQLKKQWTSEEDLLFARDRSTAKKVLIIEHQVPNPTNDSGAVRLTALIRVLKELGYGTTLWAHDLKNPEPQTSALQREGVEVVYGLQRFEDFAQHRTDYFDTIILSRADLVTNYIEKCREFFPRARLIYDTIDLSYLRIERQAILESSESLKAQSKQWKEIELFAANEADVTLVVSDIEKMALREKLPNQRIETVSNIHQLRDMAKPFKDRKNLLFIGNYRHEPNIDAVVWFSQEVLPILLKRIPDITFTILGSNVPDSVKNLASESINVIGYVETVESYFETHRVFVSPLRYGAGVKGKIGQSIEYGLPVVTTDIGAEGMHLQHAKSVLIANDSATFAEEIIKVYTNEKLWLSLQANSRNTLQQYFSADTAKSTMKAILNELQ